MKNILMIGTGGTIASKQTEYGLAPGLSAEDILNYIPAVSKICEVDSLQVCNLDSTNVTPEHWKLLVKTVQENYDRYDGFVICHGTDTLAYTAAALSYMIQNSRKPIVITGAQKPIEMDVTDAKTNLLDSFIYASDNDSQDVNIVFDGKVIVGTRARKERAKSYNAFCSINFPYQAVIQDGMLVRYITEMPYTGPVRFYYEMKNSGYVVWLTATPEAIYERVKDSTERPLLNGNMNVPFIQNLMESRREKYERAADIVIDTTGKEIEEICEELLQKLSALRK